MLKGTQPNIKQPPWELGKVTLFEDKYCTMLVRYGLDGKTFSQFCRDIAITRDQFSEWVRSNPQFAHAKAIAEVNMDAFYEDYCQVNLYDKDVNVQMFTWYSKARLRWQEPKEEPQEQNTRIVITREVLDLDRKRDDEDVD